MSIEFDDEEELFPDTKKDATNDTQSVERETDDGQDVQEKASKAARKLEPIVLAHVLGPKYQPVKPRVIAKQLRLPSEQHKALKLAIRRLAKAGKISYGAGHLVSAPQKGKVQGPKSEVQSRGSGVRGQGSEVRGRKPEVSDGQRLNRDSKNAVVGTFRRTSKGFGFVRPQGAKRGDRAGDIYIAAGATMDASDHDVVRVRLSRSQARGKGGV